MIITDSGNPITIAVCGQNELNVFNVDVTPVPKENLLDSNGAGDSFVGGFFAKLALI